MILVQHQVMWKLFEVTDDMHLYFMHDEFIKSTWNKQKKKTAG